MCTDSCGMNEDNEEFVDDSILYELLEYLVRKQEPELTKCKNDTAILPTTGTIKNALRYLNQGYSLPKSVSGQISLTLPWKFAVGDSGRLIAILQENLIEIRKSKDEYSSIAGKASVPKDAFPQWRKIAWSPDCSFLAMASSGGQVSFYNSLGNNIFNISPKSVSQNPGVLEAGEAIASMIFLEARTGGSIKWDYEFITVTYSGSLRCFRISITEGFDENHEFSFGSIYRNGVTAVAYNKRHNLLFVAGSRIVQKPSSTASEIGLTSWRLLNDYPHYKLHSVDGENATSKLTFSLWNFIPTMRSQPESTIFETSISPNGNSLACLHTDGSISYWGLPNLHLRRKWKLSDQPDYNACNPLRSVRFKKFPEGFSEFHPVDIGWWSDRSLVIARYSGSVSVCSVKDLRNLLGASPEFLGGQPQVAELLPGKGFLSLDCETFVTSKKRSMDGNNDRQNSDVSSESEREDDDQEPVTIANYTTTLMQSALYSITDMERFQPKKRKLKLICRTYRILGLKSTTPEELYSRKIEIDEYEEALALANTYNLDTDLVYQTQWRKSEFSLRAIREHLSKVSKRSWVLNECVIRVPDTLEAARELLTYGLRGTSLETLVAIGINDDGKFASVELDEDRENADESDTSSFRQIQRECQILGKIDFENLTEAQRDLVRYRRKLLDHLDKLQTYGIILESPQKYDKDFYREFRQATAVENAVRFAKDNNYRGVEIMFTYHGEKLMPHWLAIVSFFPETVNPENYQKLLPECDSEGQLFLFDQRELRRKDWSKKIEFSEILGETDDDGSQFIYDSDPSLCAYRDVELTVELLQRWYKSRAYQIERDSCMVDNALQLIKIGKSRNITGLEALLVELETLDDLVYKVYLENISLTRLETLTDLEKVALLMSTAKAENFMSSIKNLVLPFIERRQMYSDGECQKHLLHDYLISLSREDLTLPAVFFETWKASGNLDAINVNAEDVGIWALDCLYACHDTEMYEKARQIFESIARQSKKADPIFEELERELECIRILKKYHVESTLHWIRENKSRPEEVKLLFIRMARSLNKITPSPDENAWDQLLSDMLKIQGSTFPCLDIEICFEICVSARLVSGIKANIQNCAKLMETRKNEKSLVKVSYDKAVNLILQASTEYFDSSKSLTDPNMELAKAALHLIEDDNERIKEEYDLISSLQILNEFNVDILPLQVRLTQDRLKLIESCLNNRQDAYRSKQRLLTLANYLRVEKKNSRSREGKVLDLVARKAFELKDYDACASTCRQLMESNYTPAWKVAFNLGFCEQFRDLKCRQRCLWFAMDKSTGTSDLLEESLRQMHLLEVQILHKDLENWLPPNDDQDLYHDVESDDEFTDAVTTPQAEAKEFVPSVLDTSTKAVKSSAEFVKNSTFDLIKNVGNKHFWKGTLNLIGGVESATGFARRDTVLEQRNDDKQSFPCFYESLHESCKISNLDVEYTKYSTPDTPDAKLKLCQTLLRVALSSESACYGLEASDVDHLLLECARYTLPEDCLLGLAYLLSLRDNHSSVVRTIFSNLPQSSSYVQLAAYFYSLSLYKTLNPNATEVYYYDPMELIRVATTMTTVEKTNQCEIAENLRHFRSLLLDGNASNTEEKCASPAKVTTADEVRPVKLENSVRSTPPRLEDRGGGVPGIRETENYVGKESSDLASSFSARDDDIAWTDDWGDFSDQSEEDEKESDSAVPDYSGSNAADDPIIVEEATEEDRFSSFNKILDTMRTKDQYFKLKETLSKWPKFTEPSFITSSSHPVLRMLETATLHVTKENTPDYESQILRVFKELMDGQSIPKDAILEFLKRREGEYSPEHGVYIRLCSDEPSLHEEAVDIIKRDWQNLKLLPPILNELFVKNLTASFGPDHTVYNQILEEVFLDCNRSEIEENIGILINRLVEQKYVPHAAALLSQLEGIPPALSTFQSTFHLLMKK